MSEPEPLAVDDRGELLASCPTLGNVANRQVVPQLFQRVKRLISNLFGDKGHLFQPLTERPSPR